MKCKACGEEIKYVKIHRFAYDGGDIESYEKILGGNSRCYYIDVDMDPTMFEFLDSYKDFISFIRCPECNKFPFKGSVGVRKRAHVIFEMTEREEMS